ncbi:serine hydrolase domain-containing protein [Candidatus Palauibacter sp.]|uniref:serine hydrolase domain-containing protein n=1 Tax=Candidatus Palauibacter sp. TaxID=3101350 RepID=UPI003B02E6EF
MKDTVRRSGVPRLGIARPGVLRLGAASLGMLALGAADVRGQTVPDFSPVRSEIQSALVAWDQPSMAVAVAVGGEVVWEEGFGWADRERRIPATEHTMYSLASISKPITATGLMILVERGLVDLDAPANDYLGPAKIEGRAWDAAGATVRRVASHTAGLPLHYQFFYEDEPYRRPHMDETIRRYANLVTAPDERWNYSNLGYGILDYIIERVSGQSYMDFMRDEVFHPLGLTRTSVDIGPGLEDFTATRYATDQSPIPFYDFDHPGGSAVFSSAHDLVRFGMFHLGHDLDHQRRILSDASIEAMRQPIRESAPDNAYGIGWTIRDLPGGLTLQRHGGGMGGVRTELAIAPEENAAVVVLSNSATPLTGYISNLLWHTLFPDAVPKPTRPEVPDPHRLQREGILEEATEGRAPLIDFAPMPDLTGDWVGEVDTHLGPHRLALAIDDDGRVHVQLGDDLWTLLNNARFDGEYLRGGFRGDIGTEDASRTDSVLSLELRLRGDVLNGSVIAITLPNVRLGNALTHWAELRRRGTQ